MSEDRAEYESGEQRYTVGRFVLQASALIVAALGTHMASTSVAAGLAIWLLGAWMFLTVAPNLRRRLRGVRNAV